MHNRTQTPFGDRIGRAAAEADDASVDLLRAVEETVNALQTEERHATAVSSVLTSLVEIVHEKTRDKPLDPTGEAEDALQKAQRSIRAGYSDSKSKRAEACADSRLHGEKEEAVVASFDLAMKALEGLHDNLEELRVAVREHDADVDEQLGNVSERFDNVNDLIARLKEESTS